MQVDVASNIDWQAGDCHVTYMQSKQALVETISDELEPFSYWFFSNALLLCLYTSDKSRCMCSGMFVGLQSRCMCSGRQPDRQTDTRSDRQASGQTGRQSDRPTGMQPQYFL